ITARHALTEPWADFFLENAMDCAFDECASIFEAHEIVERADAIWWAAPDGVKELAALRRSEAGLGQLPALGRQARCCEGLERALRLTGENRRTPLDTSGREGNAASVFKSDCERFQRGGCGQIRRQRLGRACKLDDEAGRARFQALPFARLDEAN